MIDFGIFNVIVAIVSIFSILSSALIGTTQRYLTLNVVQNDNTNTISTNNLFSQFVILYFIIAIFILLLSETIGIWFFFDNLDLPNSRKNAAFIFYHLSILFYRKMLLYV